MLVEIPVSGGDLIDRITILEIKAERMTDPRQLDNVRAYLEELRSVRNRAVAASPELTAMTGELKALNGALWDVEDELRRCERRRTSARGSSSWPAPRIGLTIAGRPSSGASTSCWTRPSSRRNRIRPMTKADN
jgi:hypothetical protein